MGLMKKINRTAVKGIVFLMVLVFGVNPGHASDTCMFEVTADDVPPNIVILIDNGAEMKHPVTHGDYDSSVDYTPNIEEAETESTWFPTAMMATDFIMIMATLYIH
jgi:hypothetical protein